MRITNLVHEECAESLFFLISENAESILTRMRTTLNCTTKIQYYLFACQGDGAKQLESQN